MIDAIHATDRQAGLAINPETPAESVFPHLSQLDLLLVMTVHPGFGGQAFLDEVLPKLAALAAEVADRGLDIPIAVDGGVNLDTIGAAYAAGGVIFVVGSALYGNEGDLAPAVAGFRTAATGVR